ncbi:MAG: class I SAM-dependent methyltransferase [Deltaproteobacteria bacterium]
MGHRPPRRLRRCARPRHRARQTHAADLATEHRNARLSPFVEIVQGCAQGVPWSEPVCLLLIDGLHDYPSVLRDFTHESFLVDGELVAFHDYADYFLGVPAFVDELSSVRALSDNRAGAQLDRAAQVAVAARGCGVALGSGCRSLVTRLRGHWSTRSLVYGAATPATDDAVKGACRARTAAAL